MEDALFKNPRGAGFDRCDDVYELGDVGDLDHVGVPNETHQEHRGYQRIFKVVRFIEQRRRERAFFAGVVACSHSIPNVPFIETQIYAAVSFVLCRHGSCSRINPFDLLIDRNSSAEKVRRVVVVVADIAMQTDVIRKFRTKPIHDVLIPLQIRWHLRS